ncbi:hypothetical protein [Paraprevotella xylaniphila]|uniref:hypothetical protein n=1 Tax=Paraprevotella xylaniphila TaxID=454155 RepID=UPI0023F1DF56|nr:hypothetical protein [Paraprevotella xylaniphila]
MIRLTPILIAPTSQVYMVEIGENLVRPFCANAQGLPKVSVSFNVVNQQFIGTTQTAVTVDASVSVIYRPAGSTASVVRQFNEQFTVGFTGTAGKVPDITFGLGTPNAVAADNVKCGGRAYGIRTFVPLSINAAFPA